LGRNRNTVMAANVRAAGASFESDTPRQLFSLGAAVPSLASPWEISTDGQRFLIEQPADEAAGQPLTVVTNWQAGLKR